MEADLSTSSISNIDQEELLKSAKAKMGEVKEENERLKKLLAQIAMDYKSLEKQISSIAQSKETRSINNDNNHKDEDNQDPQMVSLTLGSWSSTKTNKKHIASHDEIASNKRRKIDGGLELGLDCKFEQEIPDASATNSMKNSTGEDRNGESKEEENIETWSPNRGLKSKEKTTSDEDQSLPQPQVKKTRVCIRSRCDTPTMNDGCQWRKYGQKIAKGNPCPRAYYRCTVSPTCPVRKQVQRCPDDMSILITTYEGTHDHSLPLAATAMASATSAAAAMLKSGSLASQQTLVGPNHPTSTTTTSSFGLQMSSSTLMNPFNTTINPRLSITNPSMISASSHSHPTVTLDLTTPNNSLAPFNNWLSSSSSRKTSSSFLNFSSSPPSSTTSLDFTTTSISALPTSTNSSSWANGYFNYGTLFPFNNNISNNNNNSNINARNNVCQNPSNSQQYLNETIATMATKAIASNPNFQSFLAAAISSYVGNNSNNNINNDPKKSTSSPSSNSQGNSLTLFPSSKNNASVAADDTRDHIS